MIKQMETQHWQYTRNPRKDFSRIRKWAFGETMRFIISMEENALEDELLKYFDYSADTPTNYSFTLLSVQLILLIKLTLLEVIPQANTKIISKLEFFILCIQISNYCSKKKNPQIPVLMKKKRNNVCENPEVFWA